MDMMDGCIGRYDRWIWIDRYDGWMDRYIKRQVDR